MMEGFKQGIKKQTILCFGFLVASCSLVFSAWTTSLLWLWFLTPTVGLAAPALLILLGLRLLLEHALSFLDHDYAQQVVLRSLVKFKMGPEWMTFGRGVLRFSLTTAALVEGFMLHTLARWLS